MPGNPDVHQSAPRRTGTGPIGTVARRTFVGRPAGGRSVGGRVSGRGGGIRTRGLVLPKHVRYRCATPRRRLVRENRTIVGFPAGRVQNRPLVAADRCGSLVIERPWRAETRLQPGAP